MIKENKIYSFGKVSSINVTQTLELFKNPNTNLHDSVLIQYKIQNNTTATQSIGLRIMLDTKLGLNDGAPLFIGKSAIKKETKVSKQNLYPYWQAFDQLISSNIIAQGILSLPKHSILAPDNIHLANWGTLVDTPWTEKFTEGNSFIRSGEKEKDTAYHDTIFKQERGVW